MGPARYVIKEMRLLRAPPTQLQTEDLDFYMFYVLGSLCKIYLNEEF